LRLLLVMKKISKALLPTCSILFFVLLLAGCDKDFASIESDVIGEDNANFDTPSITIPITAYNKKLDAVQISNLTETLLGLYNDPLYGKTTASFVSQITPSLYNPDFGIKTAIDSVVLTIPYHSTATGSSTREDGTTETLYALDSLYGNPETPIKLSVHKNTYFLRDFNPSSEFNDPQRYYSNANNTDKTINSAFVEATNITTINFENFKTSDLIYVNNNFEPSNEEIVLTTGSGDTKEITALLEPSFRVHLDTTLWHNEIIKKQDLSVLSNANNFKDHFRGLYFKAEAINDNGSMVLLNLANSKANIVIYYSKDTSSTDATRIQSTYTLNFSGNKLNTFINDFDKVNLTNGNKSEGDQNLYLKNLGSMAVVDLFPDLNELEILRAELKDGDNQNALINEAQLVIYENIPTPLETDKYNRLYAYDIENNTPILDYSFDQTTNTNDPLNSKFIHLGQRLEETEDSGVWKYKIRITEHLNRLIFQGSTNTKIGLVLSNNVNLTNNALLLNSEDSVTAIPLASILSPRGTVLHGSNLNVIENRRMSLKLYFTKPK
jgi:hypothetical protein